MVKVIKEPKDKIIKCKMCKTKFSYSASDIDWYYGMGSGYVKCPICGKDRRL